MPRLFGAMFFATGLDVTNCIFFFLARRPTSLSAHTLRTFCTQNPCRINTKSKHQRYSKVLSRGPPCPSRRVVRSALLYSVDNLDNLVSFPKRSNPAWRLVAPSSPCRINTKSKHHADRRRSRTEEEEEEEEEFFNH
jgi:hypothetical protein